VFSGDPESSDADAFYESERRRALAFYATPPASAAEAL
jgi:hypothetical protein